MQQRASKFIEQARRAKFLAKELDDTSKAKVEFLKKMILGFSIFEVRYMSYRLRERLKRGVGISPLKLSIDWPSIKASGTLLISNDS